MSHRPVRVDSVRVASLRVVVTLLALLVSGLSVTPPASAAAAEAPVQSRATTGQIVYPCGANLCSVDPATGTSTQLTSDGAGYARPSISVDGKRLAAVRGSSVVAGPTGSSLPETWATNVEGLNDLSISPDGKTVAASHWYTKLELVYEYICGGMCLKLVHYNKAEHWSSAGSLPAAHTGSAGVGFLGGALLSTDFHYGTWNPDIGRIEGSLEQVCVVANPADDAATCNARISEPDTDPVTGRKINISDPTGSPDGRLIAAVVGLHPEADGAIVDNPTGESPVIKVYDAASGAAITQIPGNGFAPTFSPDSSQLAYQGTDGFIHVVGARGGTPRKLIQGTQPSWGGDPSSDDPGNPGNPGKPGPGTLRTGTKPLTVKKSTVRLTVACPTKSTGPCRGRARIKIGKKVITKTTSYKVAAGRKKVVRLKVTRKGMRQIKRKPTRAVAELLKPGARKPSVRKKIRLRR